MDQARPGDSMKRSSIMLTIDGVDGSTPRLVAREDLIDTLHEMALVDLDHVHSQLGIDPAVLGRLHATQYHAGGLLELLEQHTRAVNALQALLALRDPDELVEAHLP